MKTIPLREFQREGVKALGAGFSAEPLLLTGRDREFVLPQVPPDDRTAVLDLAEGLSAVLAQRQDRRETLRKVQDRGAIVGRHLEQNELAISAREQQRLGGESSAERLHAFALELSQWNGLHDCRPPFYCRRFDDTKVSVPRRTS